MESDCYAQSNGTSKIYKYLLLFFYLCIAGNIYSQSNSDKFISDCKSIWTDLVVINIENKHSILIKKEYIEEYYIGSKANFKTNECIILDEKMVNAIDKDSSTKNILSYKDYYGEEWIIAYEGGASPRMDSLVVLNKKTNQGLLIPSFEWNNNDYYRVMNICIPNRDTLYTQVYNNYYSVEIRNKYTSIDNTYKEIKQEYYYIGRESKVNSAMAVYLRDTKTKVATINEGTSVFVLGWEIGKAIIKTQFGLIGWVNLETIKSVYNPDGFGRHLANIDIFSYDSQ